MILLVFLGQIVPLIFIVLDLTELGMDWNLSNAKQIYQSQRIYLFSSIATPLFYILLMIQWLKIKAQREFFFNVLNGFHDLIVVFDKNRNVVFTNTAFKHSSVPIELDKILQAKSNEKIFSWTVNTDLEPVHLLGSFNNLKDQTLLYLKNITELRLSEEKIKEQERQIQRSGQLATLGELSSGIAHEINNPLGVIIAHIEIIRNLLEEPTEKVTMCLDTIDRMVLRMTGIIKAMKRLSRVDSGEGLEKINLEELFEDVINLSQMNLNKLGVNPEIDLSKFKNRFISGSSVQLSQVLINLLTNACHAIEELEEKWIRIDLKEDQMNFYIEFSNAGPPIPEQIQEKIFQPFFTTKGPGKGTGLGLSLSKNILELHKGNLVLATASEHPTFIVTLPKQI